MTKNKLFWAHETFLKRKTTQTAEIFLETTFGFTKTTQVSILHLKNNPRKKPDVIIFKNWILVTVMIAELQRQFSLDPGPVVLHFSCRIVTVYYSTTSMSHSGKYVYIFKKLFFFSR